MPRTTHNIPTKSALEGSNLLRIEIHRIELSVREGAS